MKEKTIAICSIIFLILINSVLKPPSGYSFIAPSLPVAGIIFWLINKNELLNDYNIFVIGLFNDFVLGTPLGSSCILYYLVKLFVSFLHKRFNKKNFYLNSIKVIISFSIYFSLVYTFIIFYYKNYPSISYFFMNYLLTIFIFPIISIIFNWILNKNKLKVI
jgi:rod shape-determining protein MreD